MRASWIDPDTLPEYRTKDFVGDERHFDLVFSDEFDRYVRVIGSGRVCAAVCTAVNALDQNQSTTQQSVAAVPS